MAAPRLWGVTQSLQQGTFNLQPLLVLVLSLAVPWFGLRRIVLFFLFLSGTRGLS